MKRDGRRLVDTGKIGLDGITVESHVGVVDVAEGADHAFAIRRYKAAEEIVTPFGFKILTARTLQVPVVVDAVGDGGHEGDRIARGEVAVIVLDDGGVGVAASVGGIVPRAVVVGRPVHELEMAIGTDSIEVEEVGEAKLANAEFEAALGVLSRQGEWAATGFGELRGEPDGLVKLDTREVGDRPKGRVADDIEIGEAGKAKGLGDATPARRLLIVEDLGVGCGSLAKLIAHVERSDEGGLVLAAAEETVRAFVRRMERAMRLEDDVGLTGEEVTAAVGVGKDGGRRIVRRLSGSWCVGRGRCCRGRSCGRLRSGAIAGKGERPHQRQGRDAGAVQKQRSHGEAIFAAGHEWSANLHRMLSLAL